MLPLSPSPHPSSSEMQLLYYKRYGYDMESVSYEKRELPHVICLGIVNNYGAKVHHKFVCSM